MSKMQKMKLLVLWVLATCVLAVFASRMGSFPVKARQAEAKSKLAEIYTLQALFYEDEKRYGKFSDVACDTLTEIGFTAKCVHRYQYFIESVGPAQFVAVARERVQGGQRRVFSDCESPLDEWQIDEKGKILKRFDASSVCLGPHAFSGVSVPSLRHFASGLSFLLLFAISIGMVSFFVLLFKKSWKPAIASGVKFALFAAPLIAMGFLVAARFLGSLR